MRRQLFLRWSRWGLIGLALCGAIVLLGQPQPSKAPARAPLDLHSLPLAFEANIGQSDPAVRFVAHIPQGALFFTTNQVVLTLRNDACGPGGAGCPAVDHTPLCAARAGLAVPAPPNVLRLRFEDALPTVILTASLPLAGQVNYLVGADPSQWHTQVPIYSTMTYAGLYPHIDLEYQGTGARLKGTYQVAPGGDPAEIRWFYDGAARPTVNSDGALLIPLTGSSWVVTEQPPVAWQERDGQRTAVAVRYAVDDEEGTVGFALGAYDPALPLIIDPTLTYSTYLGGTGAESGWAVAVDSAGNAYITGATNSANFPVQNAYQPQYGGGSNDAFVAKLNAGGTALVYATYLGGSGEDMGLGLMVDAAGDAYVAGSASSLDFPLVNPVQASYGGGNSDAFLAELNPSGTALLYSTYLGGNYDDCTIGAALGPGGALYTVGYTASTTFPVVNAIQPASGGDWDAFVTKLAPGGGSLLYSTYLGGSAYEFTSSFALDNTGAVYITGETDSTNFPLAQPWQAASGGAEDAFVTKINPSGSALVYSTYLGGNGADAGWGIALDAAGAVYVQGKTLSPNFPLRNPLQPTYGGAGDAFVAKLNAAGSALVYSTYLGGSGLDNGRGIAVDSTGAATVGGTTASPDFPLVTPLQSTYGGQVDAYLAQLNPAGTALNYSTFLGGSREEVVCGVAVDANGNGYLTGWTDSWDFPTHNAVQPVNGGWYDAIVVKVQAPPPSPTATATRTPPPPTRTATPLPPTRTATPVRPPSATMTPVMTPTAPATPQPATATPPASTSTPPASATPGVSATPALTVCAVTFQDVDPNHPFYAYIRCLACRGILSGYADGTFRPGAGVTRGQVAKIVGGAAQIADAVPSSQQTFADVPGSAPFWLWVEQLAGRAILSGYQCGGPGEPCDPAQRPYFRPGAAITRGQLAKIVAGAAGFAEAVPSGQQTFADVPPGAPFWLWVERVALHGVISGYACGGSDEPCDPAQRPYFRPGGSATRAQTAKIVANTFYPNCSVP